MIVAVAGSDGFVGKHVCGLLKTKGYSIVELDIKNGIDLCDMSNLRSIPKFDCLIHLANLVYVPASYQNPELFYRVNYLTTLNTLELCRKYNARLIYISSYIYGTPRYLPIDEEHPVVPFNPYAQTKVICENLCQGYMRDFGVKISVLRPFNIFGDGQQGKLLIPEIFSQIKEGKTVINLKSASPKRDYVNVKDVALAILACLNDISDYSLYNICSGTSISVEEITQIINRNMNRKVVFSFAESDRKKEIDETMGSYKKINRELGWKPSMIFEEGILEIINSEKLY
jgi:UDP-glucose 4-epimerase